MKNQTLIRAMVLTLVLQISTSILAKNSLAWHGDGHEKLVAPAMEALPSEVPEFFRNGRLVVEHFTTEADLLKQPALPMINAFEIPNHFLDYEDVTQRPLPESYQQYLNQLALAQKDLVIVGRLPYAIVEWTERLTLAFAEYRKYPQNKEIPAKALTYAGFLSHYLTDMAQPLHTTVHYDGKVTKEVPKPRSGIHTIVDGIMSKLVLPKLDPKTELRAPKTTLFQFVVEEFEKSHAEVEPLYALESKIRASGVADPAVREFFEARALHAIRLQTELFYLAWVKSKEIVLPSWHVRPNGEAAAPLPFPSKSF